MSEEFDLKIPELSAETSEKVSLLVANRRIAELEGVLRDVQRRIDATVSRQFGLDLLKRINAALTGAA